MFALYREHNMNWATWPKGKQVVERTKLYSPFSEEQYTCRNDDSLFRYFSLSPRRPAWITCHEVLFSRCGLYILMKVITLSCNFPEWVTIDVKLWQWVWGYVFLWIFELFSKFITYIFSPFDFRQPFSYSCCVLVQGYMLRGDVFEAGFKLQQ